METEELLREDTIPTEEADVQEAETDAETAPQEETDEKTDSTEETEAGEGEPTAEADDRDFTIRYKHSEVKLTQDEARRFAQIGKHYEENVKETIDNLDYLATLQGKTVKDLVKELVDGVELRYREELTEQLGEDNPLIEEMLEYRRAKNKKVYEDAVTQREKRERQDAEQAAKSVGVRLAEQFEEIGLDFPEYKTLRDIPKTVIKRAISSGDLEKEMLRYERSERKKIEAARASQEKNSKQCVGSVQSLDTETGTDYAFMRGLWG